MSIIDLSERRRDGCYWRDGDLVAVLELMYRYGWAAGAAHAEDTLYGLHVIPDCPKCHQAAPDIATTAPGCWACTACGHEFGAGLTLIPGGVS